MITRRSFTTSLLAGAAAMAASSAASAKPRSAGAAGANTRSSLAGNPAFPTRYRTVDIDGTSVFYREAGAPGAPVVLLLPGWPSSSAMFRDLIRELSANYHVFAPDYPGFGNSDVPDRSHGVYTFDALGETIGKLVDKVGIEEYALYATDFGGLVGYRVMLKTPGRMKALIAQNNPLFLGASPWFGPLLPYWKDGTTESREQVRQHYLTLDVVRDLYTTGVSDTSLIDPGLWQVDHASLQRPGAADISLDLLYDIRTNGPALKNAQDYLRAHQPPTLVVSGKNDILFPADSQLRYREVVPKAEIHLTDSGHCALADKSEEIALRMQGFLSRVL
ncbi:MULTISPECIES: alpha/beta hydrolase [unclassified Burkholderia]|uniref:alpha/beta fold hydrolase n=1 Tax=unclassified Burkholderia TaxID=2613784 RepID=UPI001422E51F|nr:MULTISPECIES: alpha/beta hydrolase [unclassified Burkholderia]NIE82182.1 alpha/beta hydrolase [Burkholderia sp. Tr-860]NIF62009.1 alpha/beta hydrolase [Burkholderia sp. Cy-647]NIF93660.1 alpha/beta hydrolase [Burkholderia sp. Ax-1720]